MRVAGKRSRKSKRTKHTHTQTRALSTTDALRKLRLKRYRVRRAARAAGRAERALRLLLPAPECLLGIDVDVANARGGETGVVLRDVRGLIARGSGICRRAAGLIIRSDNCSAELRAAPWVCPPGEAPPVLAL